MVAYLNKREKHHRWACDIFSQFAPPFFTCEAVIAEACFLMQPREYLVLDLIRRNLIQLPFSLADHTTWIIAAQKKYENLPMSLADACLVSLMEIIPNAKIITLNSDFEIYRIKETLPLALIKPD